jgi:hypothetical protein
MASDWAKTLQVYGIREATETVDSPARAPAPEPKVLDPTLARGDPTEARNLEGFEVFDSGETRSKAGRYHLGGFSGADPRMD